MKKKSKITLTVFMFNIIIFPGCEKAVVYKENLSVTLKYNQQAVPDIYIYYYSGIPLKDSSGNTRYHGMQLSAAEGSTILRQLTPGSYHFTASGFLEKTGKIMRADTDIIVRKRYRDESNYQVLLQLRSVPARFEKLIK